MKKAAGKVVIRIFPLPRRATGQILGAIAEQLVRGGDEVAAILDCRRTEHVDYRALRRFVRRMRQTRALAGPVRLVGLNPYCLQIVRFTLDAADYELFAHDTAGTGATAPRGNDVVSARIRGRSARGGAGAGAFWWPVSPN